jgi:hypothetical protein
MKNNEERLDRKITELVHGIGPGVPEALERRIADSVARHNSMARGSRKRRPWLMTLVPATAIASAFVVFLAVRPEPGEPIEEIRTEFEIADKNIKVIFFQKPDFHLFEEEQNAKD